MATSDESGGMLHVSVRNQLTELERLSAAVHAFAKQQSLPPETVYAIDLTVEEVVTNIIKYGYDDADAHDVAVSLRLAEGHVDVDIEDDGHEFDPLQAPQPDTEVPIDERPIGGLGLFLVRNLAQDVSYERVQDKNRLRVRIALSAK